jgi:hypothetical protein
LANLTAEALNSAVYVLGFSLLIWTHNFFGYFKNCVRISVATSNTIMILVKYLERLMARANPQIKLKAKKSSASIIAV